MLLVSHNMSAITRMCSRAILINEGKVVRDGPATEVVGVYWSSGFASTSTREWPDPTTAPGGKVARLRAVRVRNEDGQITDTVDIRRPVNIEVEYEVIEPGRVLLSFVQFHTQDGVMAFESNDLDPKWRGRPRPCGRWVSTACISGNLLSEGILFVTPGLITRDPVSRQFFAREAVAFQIVDYMEGDSARGDWNGNSAGVVRPLLKWNTEHSPT